MPKRWFLPLLVAACWFAVSGAVAQPAADRPVNVAIPVYLDGVPVVWETTPKITAGRLVVPIGDLAAAVNGEVIYDPAAGTVRVEKKGTVLELGVGQAQVRKNGETVTWETAPLLLDGQAFAPLRSLAGALDLTVAWQDSPPAVFLQTGRQGVLPVVGTREKLQALLAEAERTVSFRPGEGDPARKNVQAADRAEIAPGAAPATGGSGSGDYSRTNLQVAGVDEADLVKTDGEYIYQVNGRRVVVVKAVPPDAMQVMSVLDWGEAEFRPREIYVDDRFLVVIGSSGQAAWAPASGEAYRCPPFLRTVVKAMVYDLQDRSNLQKLREVELTGDYVSSRKVGPALYLVANKDLPYHILRSEDPAGLTPSYRDSAAGNRPVTVGLPEIRYFPGFTEPNYLLVAGLNLEKPAEPLQVDTYLGSGGNIYVSPQNMYITVSGYRQSPVALVPAETNSQIYKFSLQDGRVNYRAKTEVPGRILNQFSLDEYAGYCRVATTTGEIWRTDEHTAKNNVYILDADLQLVGWLENLAPGERIYAARFMGDRGYLVTFKNVDPLFVLDLQNPRDPQVLGALKIPGYSDYLHPYGENHLIGFGKDTVTLSTGGREPFGTGTFYLGMKMAIFDVTDVRNPKELFVEKIGDRGTDSPLLRDHKALLFSPEKNLLAFPVTVMEAPVEADPAFGIPRYGDFAFQGAYVYQVDLANGFSLQKKITHLNPADYRQAGSAWYAGDKNVDRIIYSGDTLYTLSNAMIKAHTLAGFTEAGGLDIPR